MKTLKTLFLTLIMAIGFASTASATKDTIMYNGNDTYVNGTLSNTLTTNVGDTIVFYSALSMSINYMVNTTSFPGIAAMQYFQYKVVGTDVPSFTVTASYFTLTQTVVTVYVNNITTGVAEKAKTNNLTLFPNPTKNTFTVASIKTANISVYNQLGSLVKQQAFENEAISLNITDLPQGVYMVEVWTDGKRSLSRLVKE